MSYDGNEAYLMIDNEFVDQKKLIFQNTGDRSEEEKIFRPMDAISGAKIRQMMIDLGFEEHELNNANLAHSEQRMLAYAMDLLETGYYNEDRPLNLKILTRKTCCPMCYEAIKRFKDKYGNKINLEVIDFGQGKYEGKWVPCFWEDKTLVNPEAIEDFYGVCEGKDYEFFGMYKFDKKNGLDYNKKKCAVKYYNNNIFKNFYNLEDKEKTLINEKVNVDDKSQNENIKTFDYITKPKPNSKPKTKPKTKTYRGNILYTLESLKDGTGNPCLLNIKEKPELGTVKEKFEDSINSFKEQVKLYNEKFEKFKNLAKELKLAKKEFKKSAQELENFKNNQLLIGVLENLFTKKGPCTQKNPKNLYKQQIEEDKIWIKNRFLEMYGIIEVDSNNLNLKEIDSALGFSFEEKAEEEIIIENINKIKEQQESVNDSKQRLDLITKMATNLKEDLKNRKQTVDGKIDKKLSELNNKNQTLQRKINTLKKEGELQKKQKEELLEQIALNKTEIKKYNVYKEVRAKLIKIKEIEILEEYINKSLLESEANIINEQNRNDLITKINNYEKDRNRLKIEVDERIKALEDASKNIESSCDLFIEKIDKNLENCDQVKDRKHNCYEHNLIYPKFYSHILENINKEVEKNLIYGKEIFDTVSRFGKSISK